VRLCARARGISLEPIDTTEECGMNWDRIEGNWKIFSGKVQERWGKLTNDDLDRIRGRRDALEGRLQELYGIQRDHAKREVDEFTKMLEDVAPRR
jgi:uncharacterized protein YjbJ (UPF0337 family)